MTPPGLPAPPPGAPRGRHEPLVGLRRAASESSALLGTAPGPGALDLGLTEPPKRRREATCADRLTEATGPQARR